MPSVSNKVHVNPEILKWARTSLAINIEKAANIANITPERYEKWELGEEKPTIAKLRNLANLYKRPLAVFFLSKVPQDVPQPRDFRVLYEGAVQELTKNSRLAIRKAQWYQSVARELMIDLGYSGEFTRKDMLTLNTPVQNAVKNIRKMSFVSQMAWETKYIALKNWREYIESQGIFVFQFNMPLEEMRGFSLVRDGYPSIIVLNSTDSVNGRIFTLFHEFGHVLLNQAGICCPQEIEFRGEKHDRVERYCNEFAGNFLIPTDELQKMKLRGGVDLDFVCSLAQKCKVSNFVVLRRLYDIGKLDYKHYEEYYKVLLKKIKKSEAKGGDFYKNIFAERGKKFIRLVVEAESSNSISTSKALDILGVKLSSYDRVRESAY